MISGVTLTIRYNMCLIPRKLDLLHVNNKEADQPEHPHSLISAFFIQSQKSITTVKPV